MNATPTFAWHMAALFLSLLLGSLFAGVVVPGLVRRYRDRFGRVVGGALRQAFIDVHPNHLVLAQVLLGLLLASVVAWLTGSLFASLIAALSAGLAPRVAVRTIQRRRLAKFRQQLPDMVMLMAGSLRSGGGLALAMSRSASGVAAPAGQELDLVLRELRLGTTLSQALVGLERRAPAEETVLFATALRISSETGGPLVEVLEQIGETTRKRLAVEGKIRALTAQGRMQAWVMAMLPLIVMGLLAWVDPPSFAELVGMSSGRWVLLGVMLGQLAGFFAIRRVVAVEV